jgi:hypothetical protein
LVRGSSKLGQATLHCIETGFETGQSAMRNGRHDDRDDRCDRDRHDEQDETCQAFPP